VFDKFPKYHTGMLLGDFNAAVRKEGIFKPRMWNICLHEISKGNRVPVVNFATSENLTVNSRMFQLRDIYKYTWTSLDGETHRRIGRILVDRRWNSGVLDV
jgi:hypothetical protein